MKSDIQMIPLSELTISTLNVRKKEPTKEGMDAMIASIKATGILHNLIVHPCKDGKHKYAIADGGRRFRAAKALVKCKHFKAAELMPCRIVSEAEAAEASLAANVNQEATHPADQVVRFKELIDGGSSVDDIASRFNVSPLIIQRRLKIANVAPTFIDLYRKDAIDYDSMVALAITDDHEKQLKVWNSMPKYNRNAWHIRQLLTDGELSADDKLVRFVGLKAYEKAGGFVRRDLFCDRNEGFITDTALLHTLVSAKLEKERQRLLDDGQSWVETHTELTWNDNHKYPDVPGAAREPNKKEAQQLNKLQKELDTLQHDLADLDEESDQYYDVEEAIDAKQEELEALKSTLLVPDPRFADITGSLVTIDHNGKLEIIPNRIRPQDAKERKKRTSTLPAASTEVVAAGVSSTLSQYLSAQVTDVMRVKLAEQPHVALVVLAHALVPVCFEDTDMADSGSVVATRGFRFEHTPTSIAADTAARSQFDARRAAWQKRLPETNLFAYLLSLPIADLQELLAVCTAYLACANTPTGELDDNALDIMRALQVNITEWWKPTAETYFNYVTKTMIADSLTEAGFTEEAAKVTSLKKSEAAALAETTLQATAWRPALMRW